MFNSITQLLGIRYPIIQAGMVWASGWRLASAVSNAGGLGLLGAGSMYPEVLRKHIQKCKKATNKPFGVNRHRFDKDDNGIPGAGTYKLPDSCQVKQPK